MTPAEARAVLAKVRAQVTAHYTRADRVHHEVSVAQRAFEIAAEYKRGVDDHERALAEAEELCEPDFIDHACGDIASFERAWNQFAVEASKETLFFRPPPARRHEVVGGQIEPNAYLEQRPSWRFCDRDCDHPQSWRVADVMGTVLEHLSLWEKMTWKEIRQQSRHNHPWESYELWEPPSRKKVLELELDDVATWQQLHVQNMGRLFGFREGAVFHILWWDALHEVYKTKGR